MCKIKQNIRKIPEGINAGSGSGGARDDKKQPFSGEYCRVVARKGPFIAEVARGRLPHHKLCLKFAPDQTELQTAVYVIPPELFTCVFKAGCRRSGIRPYDVERRCGCRRSACDELRELVGDLGHPFPVGVAGCLVDVVELYVAYAEAVACLGHG